MPSDRSLIVFGKITAENGHGVEKMNGEE